MADSTRINELQEKMLQAMSIVNGKLLDTISYDKTITATISDNTDKADGKYILTDGSKTFTAYSTVTNYSNNTTVYVTIPNGNWENQKMIIGKKTSDAETPFVFTTPFDTMFDMTGNIVKGFKGTSILANAPEGYNEEKNKNIIFQFPEDNDKYNSPYENRQGEFLVSSDYTRLGLSADFCTWLKNAVQGTYGVKIKLSYLDTTITGQDNVEVEPKYWIFDNNSMCGDTYNFESFYNQQIVFDISKYGAITKLQLSLVELGDFYDEKDVKIPFENEGNILFDNIFVKDVYLCAGHDIGNFKDDYVEIYTENKRTYNKAEHGAEANKRIINLHWVHVENDEPVNITELNKETDEVCWYNYKLGAAAADDYCGVYWVEKPVYNEIVLAADSYKNNTYYIKKNEEFILDTAAYDANKIYYEKNKSMSLVFDPDTEKQQEKIKAIVFRNKIPYRSNELIFYNEEDVPSQSTIEKANALNIIVDDNTNGNYFLYGQDDCLLEKTEAEEQRTLTCWFSSTGENHSAIAEDDYINTTWYFPKDNSMLNVINADKSDNIFNIVIGKKPIYQINSSYDNNKNNTVICKYVNLGREYSTEKEFSFGRFGTMGTEQTLVIDFCDKDGNDVDTNAITVDGDTTYYFKVQSYQNGNSEQAETVNWSWLYNSADDLTMTSLDNGVLQINTNNSSNLLSQLYILQAQVGSLITHFSIPFRKNGYNNINGATSVIYKSNGETFYSSREYELFQTNDDKAVSKVNNVSWEIICPALKDLGTNSDEYKQLNSYIGTIQNNKLYPCVIYIEDAPVYGIQASINNEIVWTQPILITQNRWASGAINQWSGNEIIIDKENGYMLSPAIAAGKKESIDNSFSGVMIGDWSYQDGTYASSQEISGQTGIYGFSHGAMSYAFKDDGKAFIGKSGAGRILFDGNDSIIQSASYDLDDVKQGIKINLKEPYLILSNKKKGTANSSTSTYPFQIGSNFKVKWDGTIYATDGDFEGAIKGSSITSSAITGTTITSSSIYSDKINVGSSPYYVYEYQQQNWDESWPDEWIEGSSYFEPKDGDNIRYRKIKQILGEYKGSIGEFTGNDENGTTSLIGIQSDVSIAFETEQNIRLGKSDNTTTAIYLQAAKIEFIGADADAQSGIYARFA